MYIIGRFLDW